MRSTLAAAAMLALALPAAAQQHSGHHAGGHHAEGGEFPAGWQGRVDRETQRIEDVRFMAMGSGFHAITGPHVILWSPQNVARDMFTAAATFTQNRAPERLEGFGLLVGGRDLDETTQDYLYFLIRHDGSYMIRHRAGAEVHTLVDWTTHDAIVKPSSTGRASNTIAIESREGEVRFVVNGRIVNRIERVPMLNTNGIVGFRMGHHLDVHITQFSILRH